jgi:hypothetical protein
MLSIEKSRAMGESLIETTSRREEVVTNGRRR